MLQNSSLELLKNKKNLLAFSGGVDSSALLFLLIDAGIDFDIAIVNYATREQSKDEVSYASSLANKYKLKCHSLDAPKISKNFEAKAREIRYDFFESLISEYRYDNLLTAHHLGDRFEWMLMQFCKGAGCVELSSMKTIEKRNSYDLIRPLLHLDKSELLVYLNEHNITYFVDESNEDEDITRNYFRRTHTQPLLEKHLRGIKKSFEYIDADAKELIDEIKINTIKDFAYFTSAGNDRSDIYHIDKYLKKCGLMISANERELLKNKQTIVLGRKYVVSSYQGFIFIAPYIVEKTAMPHEFKERMRKLKIEPKLRNYFFANLEVLESLEGVVPLQ